MCQLLPILILNLNKKITAKLHAYLQTFLPFKFRTDWDRTGMMTTMIMRMMMMVLIIIIIITDTCELTELFSTINWTL